MNSFSFLWCGNALLGDTNQAIYEKCVLALSKNLPLILTNNFCGVYYDMEWSRYMRKNLCFLTNSRVESKHPVCISSGTQDLAGTSLSNWHGQLVKNIYNIGKGIEESLLHPVSPYGGTVFQLASEVVYFATLGFPDISNEDILNKSGCPHLDINDFRNADSRQDFFAKIKKAEINILEDFERKLMHALNKNPKLVIISTNTIAPFARLLEFDSQISFYPSEDTWRFCNPKFGHVLSKYANQYPDTRFVILTEAHSLSQNSFSAGNIDCFLGNSRYRCDSTNRREICVHEFSFEL